MKKSPELPDINKRLETAVLSFWKIFNESPEKRQRVLDSFAEMQKLLDGSPDLAEWIANLKKDFLKAEAKND